MWVVCDLVRLQKRIPNKYVLKKMWTMCSKYDDHSKLNNQHIWENLYDHLISMEIFTFMMNKGSKITREMARASIWIC